ncbi:MAG: type II toxin-antitoxin system HicB family antitoxin [Acidobacteria bacterium]|nr:type II toxin-antitoxin system HicB family antitoxin [Acidobacteriota bacterium]
MLVYQALFEPDLIDGGFVISFPGLGGYSQGDTEEEGRAMALDLLRTLLHDRMKRGEEVLPGKVIRGSRYRLIALPVLEAAKVELYCALRASGLRKVDLARRMGIAKGNVDRLFDLRHASRMEQIEAAYSALGLQLRVVVEKAA